MVRRRGGRPGEDRISWYGVAIIIAIFPLIVAFAIFAVFDATVIEPIRTRRARRRAVRICRGRPLLVLGSRHGWRDFLANNVVAQFGDQVVCVWKVSSENHPTYALLSVARNELHRCGKWPSFPFLISLRGDGRERSLLTELHQSLLPYKRLAKRSAETQAAVRPILDEALRRHGVSLDARL